MNNINDLIKNKINSYTETTWTFDFENFMENLDCLLLTFGLLLIIPAFNSISVWFLLFISTFWSLLIFGVRKTKNTPIANQKVKVKHFRHYKLTNDQTHSILQAQQENLTYAEFDLRTSSYGKINNFKIY